MKKVRSDVQKERKRFDQLMDTLCHNAKSCYPGTLLYRTAQNQPDTVALIFGNQSITYKQLFVLASAFADVLKERGVQTRDKVLIYLENTPYFYVAYFAAWQIGAVVVPVNTFLGKRELEHIIADAQPAVVITQSDKKDEISHESVLTENDIPNPPRGYEGYEQHELIELQPDEMCALLYTSGTTGVPKGVMLSAQNIMHNMIQGLARLPLTNKQRILAALPLFHSFAQNTCVWSSIMLGCTIILVPKITRKHILHALGHKPTVFLGVPALYGLLCMLKTAPLDSIDYFISGGDALPDKIRILFAMLYGRKICNGYGMTEASPFISIDMDDELVPSPTVGRPFVGIDVQIRDEDGNLCSQNEVGRLWVRGKNIMLGYYNAQEHTDNVIKNEWLDTGDMAYIDSKQRIVIAGRLKDLIIHKGFNIYPQEIENVLLSHPNVVAAAVVGKTHDVDGQVPVAFIQLREFDNNAVKILTQWCAQNLAAYKVPKEFVYGIEDLPMTATGKVDKKALREQLS